MEKYIEELLYSIPQEVTYTTIPKELRLEDVPQERIDGLRKLLTHEDAFIQLSAAKLLSAWAVEEGDKALIQLYAEGRTKGYFEHFFSGYNPEDEHIFWAPGRMYQDTHFNLTVLNGLPIEQLKICVNPDDGGVLIVYVKAEGQPIFHFFLDVGIAFCECWNEYEVDEDDDDYRFDDLTEVWQLKGKHISAIFAEEVAGNSEITFLLEEGEKLRLYYCPTEDKSYFIKDNETMSQFCQID